MNVFDQAQAAAQRKNLLVQRMMHWVCQKAGELEPLVHDTLRGLLMHGLDASEVAISLKQAHQQWGGEASFKTWKKMLTQSKAVCDKTSKDLLVSSADNNASFVLVDDELMTARVHQEHTRWMHELIKRAGGQVPCAFERDSIDTNQAFQQALAVFSLDAHQTGVLKQMLQAPLTLVTGGPGSGKTHMASAWVYTLLQAGVPADQLALLSPTNKAAERLRTTLMRVLQPQSVNVSVINQLSITTLHRYLGVRPGEGMRHQHWLPVQYVLVDEMSMVGRSLMLKLLNRLHPQTAVVMIGDPNQLPPVQSGDAFGWMIQEANMPNAPQALNDAHQHLDALHRFDDAEQMTDVLDAIKQQDIQAAKKALRQSSTITWQPHSVTGNAPEVMNAVQTYLMKWQNAQNIDEAWSLLGEHTVITAHRQDARLHNQACLAALKTQSNHFYYPIILTANAPSLRFLNGDVGITNGRGQAWFSNTQGQLKPYPVHQLPNFQPAFAITVHRAQGSEYQHTTIISPPSQDTTFNHRWLYTAMSRAKKTSRLYLNIDVLHVMLSKETNITG